MATKNSMQLRKESKLKDQEPSDSKSNSHKGSISKPRSRGKESSIFSATSKRCSVPPLVASMFKQ